MASWRSNGDYVISIQKQAIYGLAAFKTGDSFLLLMGSTQQEQKLALLSSYLFQVLVKLNFYKFSNLHSGREQSMIFISKFFQIK